MKKLFAPALLLGHLSAFAQWQLTTPIKTTSEFEDLVMVGPSMAYATDPVHGAVLCTNDGGLTWDRRQHLMFNDPHAIRMWDTERGVVVGNGGAVHLTDDGFRTLSGSADATRGSLNCVFFVNDTLGWIGTQSGRIHRSTDGGVTWTLMASGQGT